MTKLLTLSFLSHQGKMGNGRDPLPQPSVTLREDSHRKESWGLKCGSTPVPVQPASPGWWGLTEYFHVVVLCRLPQLVGDYTGVLAGIFSLGVQDL